MTAPSSRPGLLTTLRGLLATLLETLRTRGELLVVELEEEKSRLLSLLLYGAAAFFFLSFGLVALAVFFTALFWDSHRLMVIGSFTTLFLTIGGVALLALRTQLQRGSVLFSASLRELSRDHAALDVMPEGSTPRPQPPSSSAPPPDGH